MAAWAARLLEVRESDASAIEKARRALALTGRAKILRPALQSLASALKDTIWSDRSWSARLGFGAATVTALATGGKWAGIVALGTGVGLPLWMVLGAGGSFAGMLIDEFLPSGTPRGRAAPHSGDLPPLLEGEMEIEEAEWALLQEALPAGEEGLPESEGEEAAREPLYRVFRRAFREARQRQESEGREKDLPPGPS